MICKKCGAEYPDMVIYCMECGHKITSDLDDTEVDHLLNLLLSDSDIFLANVLSEVKSPKLVPFCIHNLKTDDKKLKRQCARILGNIEEKSAVGLLIDSLDDNDAYFRTQVVVALGQINDKKALEPIINALNDKNAIVRERAAFYLGEMGEKISLQYLENLLIDKNENVKKSVQNAIEKINNYKQVRLVPEWDGYYPSLESGAQYIKKNFIKNGYLNLIKEIISILKRI